MTRLLQPVQFIDSSSLNVTSSSSLWNAGRRVSQWLLWSHSPTTETPIDVSKSLRQHAATPSSLHQYTATPSSLLQDTPTPLSFRQHTVVSSPLLHHADGPSSDGTNHHIPCINTLLPPEILGEIFRHYVYDDDNPDWLAASTRIAAHVDARTTALSLCHVCSYWNSLASSDSRLWSSLCVIWPKMSMVRLVRLWLDRSKSQPLSLFLGEHPFSEEGCSPVRDILALFISHAHRWRVVNLGLNDAVQDIFRDLPHGALSSLEFFDVAVRNWNAGSLEQLSLCLHSSPALRRIGWLNSPQDYLPTSLCWHQLTEITLGGVRTSEDLFAILLACHALRVLVVRHLSFATPRTGDGYILLPCLQNLRLGCVADVALVLDGLVLPKLSELHLDNGFRRSIPNGWNSSLNLLQRSGCQLKTFAYSELDFDEAQLVHVLAMLNFSHVTNIRLGGPISDVTLNALTNGKLPLLPQLEKAVFTSCHTSDGAFASFVSSRLQTSRTTSILKHLEANLCGPFSYSYDLGIRDKFFGEKVTIIIKTSWFQKYSSTYRHWATQYAEYWCRCLVVLPTGSFSPCFFQVYIEDEANVASTILSPTIRLQVSWSRRW